MSSNPKTAAAPPQVHDLIRQRWSPRSFANTEVAPGDLAILLEAARWAASSYNEQPWRFIVATKQDPAAFQKLLDLLVPFNRSWAKSAAVLILMVAKKTFSHNHEPNAYALHDAGAALATMALQATAMGMHVHGMAGFDRDKARTELNIPDDYEMGAFAALGYLGAPDLLPDGQKQQELASRARKPLSEIVFNATWGSPLPL